MMKQYTFSAAAFRRRFLPWLCLLLLPSLFLDLLILSRIFTRHPVTLTSTGQLDVFPILTAFIVNAILLKGWAAGWYLAQQYIYKHSFISCTKGKWVYHRKQLNLSDTHINYCPYLEFHLNVVQNVKRVHQDILINGNIERNWLSEEGQVVRNRNTNRVTIPSCFEDMDDLCHQLGKMIDSKHA